MPVPRGFLELSVDPAAMGPFSDIYPQGAANLDYPVFGRFLVYWGDPKASVPSRVTDYPAAVLYGGPAPFGWVSKTLPTFVRQWAAKLASRADAGPGSWLVVALPVAFLVPKEALAFPWTDFRWSWFVDQAPPAQYAVEGVKLAPLFRNLSTRQLDLPPPLGPGPTAIAGPLADEDDVDPVMRTWVTADRAELEPSLVIHPESIELGTMAETLPAVDESMGPQVGTTGTPTFWTVRDTWVRKEGTGYQTTSEWEWQLYNRMPGTYMTRAQAKSDAAGRNASLFGKLPQQFPHNWLWNGQSWESYG